MKILKILMASFCSLAFCFCLCSCSSNKNGSVPTTSLSSSQAKESFVGFAIYCDITKDKNSNDIFVLTKNSLKFEDEKLISNNNFVFTIYPQNNLASNSNILFSSNTTIKSDCTRNNNKLNLDLNLEIFPETKTIYVFEVLVKSNNLSLNKIAEENDFGDFPITIPCKNIKSNEIFDQIKFTFATDLTSQNKYAK